MRGRQRIEIKETEEIDRWIDREEDAYADREIMRERER